MIKKTLITFITLIGLSIATHAQDYIPIYPNGDGSYYGVYPEQPHHLDDHYYEDYMRRRQEEDYRDQQLQNQRHILWELEQQPQQQQRQYNDWVWRHYYQRTPSTHQKHKKHS